MNGRQTLCIHVAKLASYIEKTIVQKLSIHAKCPLFQIHMPCKLVYRLT